MRQYYKGFIQVRRVLRKFAEYHLTGYSDKMTKMDLKSLILSLLILSLLKSSFQHNQHLIQLILSWEDETCPGTVVVFDKHYWMEEHSLIDQLVLQYSRPLTLLQSFSNYGLLPDDDSWTGAGGSPLETLCNNVILFNRYPADLTIVYRQLTARYPYIGQVLVVTPSASEQIERFLYEFKNHKIMLVINRPWRHLELRNCCWGPDRRIRRVDLLPDSSVRWEEFGLRTSRIVDNELKEENQLTETSA